jgi:hypothetical protein
MSRDENKKNNYDYLNTELYFKLLGEQISRVPDMTLEKTLHNLQDIADDYLFDNGDLVHSIKQAIIEIKYANHIITELRARLADCESEIKRLEMLTHRAN